MPKIFSEEDKALIKEKLLRAGLKELEHKSYKRIAVEELAAQAGIAKGTFYSFFPSKESFFFALMQRVKQENQKPLLELFENGTPTREKIVHCLFKRYTRMKSVYEYFPPEDMEDILTKIPENQQQSNDDSAAFAGFIGGRIRPLSELEAETIVGMFNILGLAASMHSKLELRGYEQAIKKFCETLADYILGDKL